MRRSVLGHLITTINEQSLQIQIDGQYMRPVGPLLQSDNRIAKTYKNNLA
jgi:hypothetical protein